jgi:L,D-transpeptidase catalytic domain
MVYRLVRSMLALLALITVSFFATPATAGVQVNVNLASQTMTVSAPDGTVRKWAISSGRAGYKTIRGTYRPYMLKTYHWSRKYGGHMPNAIFFKGGFAIHGTTAVNRLGAPASHGCVRLHPAAARELFALVKTHGQRSTRIAIYGDAPVGKTMYAAKKKNSVSQVARAKTQQRLVVPAFAPHQLVPGNSPFQRLR